MSRATTEQNRFVIDNAQIKVYGFVVFGPDTSQIVDGCFWGSAMVGIRFDRR
jgi:hypothetical protein